MQFLEAAYINQGHRGTAAADCNVYAQDVVGDMHDLIEPEGDLLALWRIHHDEGLVPVGRVNGPVTAAIASGGARPTVLDLHDTELPERGTALCQGWVTIRPDGSVDTTKGDRGHTFFLRWAGPGAAVMIHSSRDTGARIEWVDMGVIRKRYKGSLKGCVLRRGI